MFDELEENIRYCFRDSELAREALTHRSFANESADPAVRDNQRLEFLGDAVLSLLISTLLMAQFPNLREGELTRLRASLVDESTLADLAVKRGFGRLIRFGRGEERGGGRGKPSILADAYEAVVGAIYLDGGSEAVTPLVEADFIPLLTSRINGSAGRDYKTDLQERVQALHGIVPSYTVQEVSGPSHALSFTIEVWLGDEKIGEGCGSSKKDGEQAAARAALAVLEEPMLCR